MKRREQAKNSCKHSGSTIDESVCDEKYKGDCQSAENDGWQPQRPRHRPEKIHTCIGTIKKQRRVVVFFYQDGLDCRKGLLNDIEGERLVVPQTLEFKMVQTNSQCRTEKDRCYYPGRTNIRSQTLLCHGLQICRTAKPLEHQETIPDRLMVNTVKFF